MDRLTIEPDDPTPPYEQIRRGVLDRIARGALLPGDRLPAIRALANDLGLAAGTAARAYRELEEAGVITTRRGAGTRIAEGLDPSALPTLDGTDPAVTRWAGEAVAEARARGLPLDQLAAAVRTAAAEAGADA
ncbi:GntR family transcriptional regulator [Brevibacterium album]|uniref:GntR family transcriptional regulator n=1 Tax=Brevibacterium album TaxID=417948 RepID=UPI0004277F92|nr:GntR family transcriptional regulator [Brevibacterium album]